MRWGSSRGHLCDCETWIVAKVRIVSSSCDNSGAQVRMCCHGPHTGINVDVTDQRFSTEFNNVDTAHTELVNTFVTFWDMTIFLLFPWQS